MKKRILIVDDERWFTNLLKYSLETEGYFDVRQENDATRALGVARHYGPDLVILDIMMPALDGSELAARLKADPLLDDVPVLFMTALVTDTDAPDGLFSPDPDAHVHAEANAFSLDAAITVVGLGGASLDTRAEASAWGANGGSELAAEPALHLVEVAHADHLHVERRHVVELLAPAPRRERRLVGPSDHALHVAQRLEGA